MLRSLRKEEARALLGRGGALRRRWALEQVPKSGGDAATHCVGRPELLGGVVLQPLQSLEVAVLWDHRDGRKRGRGLQRRKPRVSLRATKGGTVACCLGTVGGWGEKRFGGGGGGGGQRETQEEEDA